MLTTTSYIVIDKTTDERHTYAAYHECVSLNEFNKSPILLIKTPLNYQLDFGSIIDENHQQVLKYNEHDYELARVLSEDKQHSNILVYGAKIGERIVDTKYDPYNRYPNHTFYQREDLVLLKQTDSLKKLFVVHNITLEKIKAERDEFAQKAK